MADDKILISIELDDGTVKEGFLRIEKQAATSSKNVEKSVSGVDKGLSTASKTALAFVGAFAGLAAVGKSIAFLKQSIQEAAKEQDAINRLNTALALTGKFSDDASKSIQNFANTLQGTTKFGNETTLEVASLIQSLGRLDTEGLQRATKAALDLSTALGIDVNSAATLVGKAANGNVEAFGRYGIQIEKAKTQSETFANALKVLESRFGGSSEAAAQTFSGSLVRLNNIIGDFRESIGNLVLNSPSVVKSINLIGDAFKSIGESITNLSAGKDVFKPIITGAIDFVGSLTFLIQGAATLVGGLITSAVTGLIGLFQQVAGGLAGIAGEIVGFFAPNSDLAKSIKLFAADTANASAESFDVAGQAFKDAFTLESTEGTALFFADLKEQINGATLSANEFKNALPGPGDQQSIEALSVLDAFKSTVDGFNASVDNFATNAVANFKAVGDAAFKGLGNAAAQGFLKLGQGIAKGKVSLADFAGAFLQTIGQVAVQLGTNFILTGTAYLFSGNPALQGKGGPLIAAGAALATFGGVLGAVGQGGQTSTGGTAGGGSEVVAQPGSQLPETEPQQPTTQVAVNIQGDVLDSQDTGLRIVDLIQQYTDRNGRTEVLA